MRKKILVVHPIDPSTRDFEAVYDGIDGVTVIDRPCSISEDQLKNEIRIAKRVIFVGHGLPSGLIGTDHFYSPGSSGTFRPPSGLCIDVRFVDLLRERTDTVAIWCHADRFFRKHHLTGMATGMFISEPSEAWMCRRTFSVKAIARGNKLFSHAINTGLRFGWANKELGEFAIQKYGGEMSETNDEVVQFNRNNIFAFDEGKETISRTTILLKARRITSQQRCPQPGSFAFPKDFDMEDYEQ